MPNITLNKPGVYLFPASTTVSAQIDREILVVFALPSEGRCGFILYDCQASVKDLEPLLDTLFDKLKKATGSRGTELVVKAFGMSRVDGGVFGALTHWLDGKKLALAAKDIGQNVGRNLRIDCGTGRVGISYAEAYLPGFPQFLSRGSARQRQGSDAAVVEVLVLSHSAVCRQLTLQAIEEERQWTASVPAHLDDIWAGKDFPYFPWSWVILFQDLEKVPSLHEWVFDVKNRFPKVQIVWAGATIPDPLTTLPGLVLLPPLNPEHLGTFKERLRQAILSSTLPITGEVLAFPRQKKHGS